MIYWHPMVILRKELPLIQKIKRDERWLESEKRGYDVGETDPEVEKHITEIVTKVGGTMREEAETILQHATKPEYRMVKHRKSNGSIFLLVHRVFCDDDEHVCGICATPHIPCGESHEEVSYQIDEMASATRLSPLSEEDFPFADWSLSDNMLPGVRTVHLKSRQT